MKAYCQLLFAEGSYNSRLDTINEFPKGAVAWYFDKTDMKIAKQKFGQNCCIQGNVPTSLLLTVLLQKSKNIAGS